MIMNREIKFRGKSTTDKEWKYGISITLDDSTIIIEDEGVFNDGSASPFFSKWDFVISDTIGQFTGLYDKIGKDIYEGDIVKAPLLDPIFGDIINDAFCNAEIKFNKGSFVVSYYGSECNIYISDLHDKIEIIGNIYDNKDLLED